MRNNGMGDAFAPLFARLISALEFVQSVLSVRRRIDALYLCLLALPPIALLPFCEWLRVSGNVPRFLLPLATYSELLSFMLLAGAGYQMLAIPYLLILALFQRARRAYVAWLAASALFLVASGVGFRMVQPVRTAALHDFDKRSQTLISAIKAFEREKRRPPNALSELVPKFLPSVPSTGMAAYPKYSYYTGEDAAKRYAGNGWALKVNTPNGFMNWDCMIYTPKQNYAESGFSGNIEHIGSWGYVFD